MRKLAEARKQFDCRALLLVLMSVNWWKFSVLRTFLSNSSASTCVNTKYANQVTLLGTKSFDWVKLYSLWMPSLVWTRKSLRSCIEVCVPLWVLVFSALMCWMHCMRRAGCHGNATTMPGLLFITTDAALPTPSSLGSSVPWNLMIQHQSRMNDLAIGTRPTFCSHMNTVSTLYPHGFMNFSVCAEKYFIVCCCFWLIGW